MSSPDDAYSFSVQLEKGEGAEARLDRFFGRFYCISSVDAQAQRWGIDRIWWRRDMTIRCSVEYKTDWAAERTGNVFIETVSVDSQNKPGWVYTSVAQLLVYYLPQSGVAYIAPMLAVREATKEWAQTHQEMPVPNDGYNTKGLLIPLAEFAEKCQAKKIKLDSQGEGGHGRP